MIENHYSRKGWKRRGPIFVGFSPLRKRSGPGEFGRGVLCPRARLSFQCIGITPYFSSLLLLSLTTKYTYFLANFCDFDAFWKPFLHF